MPWQQIKVFRPRKGEAGGRSEKGKRMHAGLAMIGKCSDHVLCLDTSFKGSGVRARESGQFSHSDPSQRRSQPYLAKLFSTLS